MSMKKRAMREAKKKMQKKMKRRGKKKNTMKEILLEKKKRTEGVTTRKNMKHEVANDVDRPRLPILRDAAAMSNQQNDRRYLGTPVELTTNYIQTAISLGNESLDFVIVSPNQASGGRQTRKRRQRARPRRWKLTHKVGKK